MSEHMVQKRERRRWNSSRAVARGSCEEPKVLRNQLMLAACLPPGTRVTSGLGLLLRVMSGSVVLPQLGSVLIFMTHIATNATGMPRVWASTYGYFAVQGLCYLWDRVNLSGLCWSPGELMAGLNCCWGSCLGSWSNYC